MSRLPPVQHAAPPTPLTVPPAGSPAGCPDPAQHNPPPMAATRCSSERSLTLNGVESPPLLPLASAAAALPSAAPSPSTCAQGAAAFLYLSAFGPRLIVSSLTWQGGQHMAAAAVARKRAGGS